MLREFATPFELEIAAAASAAKLRIEGTLARPEATRDMALSFALEARRPGELARWL